MAYFRECPHCGANLDPGEKCECVERRRVNEQQRAVVSSQMDKLLETGWQQGTLLLCS